MLFCAYCGKSFTRKEHLERHIPSHTNVKPHRCSSCQLSFARRDLLQRHHSTYHEIRDPNIPGPSSMPTIAGRTPIACLHCAQAKTACDKRVPCSRCADKNLSCAARFARRSTKALTRARAPYDTPKVTVEWSEKSTDDQISSANMSTPTAPSEPMALDPRLLDSTIEMFTTEAAMFFSDPFGNAGPMKFDAFEFPQFNENLTGQDTTYPSLMNWNEFPMGDNIFNNLSAVPLDSLQLGTQSDGEDSSSSCDTTSSSCHSVPHTRTSSIDSLTEDICEETRKPPRISLEPPTISEFEAVLAAQSAWPLARCTQATFSGSCSRTALVHLESVEQISRNDRSWVSIDTQDDTKQHTHLTVEPLAPATRDKLSAITQSFLQRALNTHRSTNSVSSVAGYPSPSGLSFLVLPPNDILEFFLLNHARSLSSHLGLANGGVINPNDLMHNNEASTLLVLLMIAQGAVDIPSLEARCLSAGLTETCRISLFDIIERDIELCADPIVLRCALLFTILGAWGGDKWHMDIVMGQRGMYLAMLKHSGMLEPQPSPCPFIDNCVDVELQWRKWAQVESSSRLVYNWVMVDQELSLFHDLSPILSIAEMGAPLPSSNEQPWLARNASEWISVSGAISHHPSLGTSLCDLFQEFLHGNFCVSNPPTPVQLRLLLHPIQSLLCHLRQVLGCFLEFPTGRQGSHRPVTKASTMMRLEEVQSLLQKWYDLCVPHTKATPSCLVLKTSLILYHLISINAVASFTEIEKLARRERFDGSAKELDSRYRKCVAQSSEAVFHAGQVLRLVKGVPQSTSPGWLPLAIYRASMVLWVISLAKNAGLEPTQTMLSDFVVPVNDLEPDSAVLLAWLWGGDGIPVLLSDDGAYMQLDSPPSILCLALKALKDGLCSRLADGLVRKLTTVDQCWTYGAGGTCTF